MNKRYDYGTCEIKKPSSGSVGKAIGETLKRALTGAVPVHLGTFPAVSIGIFVGIGTDAFIWKAASALSNH